MKKRISKYGLWIAIVVSLAAFVVYYQNVFSTNYYSELNTIKQEFRLYEKTGNQYLKNITKQIQSTQKLRQLPDLDNPYFLHIYKNDSLIHWNTNQLPVSAFADLNFPTSGINKGQNGWYYVQTQEYKDYIVAVSFLIKNEYSYQNDYLKNDFALPFKGKFQSYISLDEAAGFPIYSKEKQYLFSIVVNDYQPASETESLILMGLLLTSIFLFLWKMTDLTLKVKSNWSWTFPVSILLIRYFSLHFSWFSFMKDTELYKASLYGTSSVFPNFFEYTLNIILIFILIYFSYKRLTSSHFKRSNILISGIVIVPYLAWMGILYLFKGLIENSSIPMHIETLFKLNVYSLIAIFTMAILGFSYFIIGKTVVKMTLQQSVQFKNILLINLIAGCIYAVCEILYFNQLIYAGLFPFAFISLIILLEYKEFKQKHLLIGMFLLALYSLVCAITINEFNQRKDKSERELYANQLMIERDVITEVEYGKLESALHNDKYLQRMISAGQPIKLREFEDGIERRHFNGFWERYECSFNLFKENSQSLLFLQGNPEEVLTNLNELINNHGQVSEINGSIYFIKDYSGQYSYIIRQHLLGKNGENATLYVTLKSKKIPEEIGFPRLLLSSKSSALKHLENYSVAKYHRNRLVSKYGLFNYPITLTAFKKANPEKLNNFDYNGYNHFIYYKSRQDVVVLSGINTTWVDNATSFSYLFAFFGILLLPFYIRFYAKSFVRKSLTLSTKIQLTLVGIVLTSLIISGISSGFFVQNQYRDYSEIAFREKTHSVELEIKPFIGKFNQLSIEENGAYLNYQLISLSKIYNTDINIYDTKGFLVSTSRQTIFNAGLLSEQINPLAKKELAELEQSEFIHTENIGTLNYNSSYSPIYNKNGRPLGYINLQQFGQQEEAEHQIQQFLVSVMNIFVLLLAASTVLAIFTANWITNPLQMLQELFSKIHLGKSNQRIQYHKNDEIGSLVQSYNEKIEELEFAAQQLAQSERESAWRDMAKQVAHEIKNPLTPMKLSVQHLMRSFDPNHPQAQERLERVSQSLIEQIDALTKIANEFSNFAKMPKPEFEKIDLVQIIYNATELFQQGSHTKIIAELPDSCIVNGDKEQLLRVFNNLIKNSLQAISTSELGVIQIKGTIENDVVIIHVSDNGIGMSDEQKLKIFTPYFTTKSTGSGIGLAMVKQIIVNHGGSIYFESEENVGTTFHIELPLIH
jgi:two-component system nitrogen regulation sensor histidine kinase NtrY